MSPPNVSRRDRRRVKSAMRHIRRSTRGDKSLMVVAVCFGVLLLLLILLGIMALGS